MDLVSWLRAQLDEDERVAQFVLRYSRDGYARGDAYEAWTTERKVNNAAPPYFDDQVIRTDRPGLVEHEIVRVPHLVGQFDAEHIARFASPARVLAEVEAKRRILDLHVPVDGYDPNGPICSTCGETGNAGDETAVVRWPCPTVHALAQPYAGQPGWRSE